MQRVNAHIQYIAVFINQANGFLWFAIDVYGFKARKLPHAVVDVGDVISFLELVNFFERQRLLGLLETFFEPKTVIALKKLVISVAHQFE